MSLIAQDLTYRHGARVLLQDVSLELRAGEVHAVIGPNGAGKSTLLRLLAGEIAASSGTIMLNGKPLAQWNARERAHQRAVLPQQESLRFGFSAAEVVALGRLAARTDTPAQEHEMVTAALAAADATTLATRLYPTLSGGERARVQFARVLAQVWTATPLGARYLLLDEPTANLDLAHQRSCLLAARAFAAQGNGVLAILHDPNLALRHADRVTILCAGTVLASGAAPTVLTAENLRRTYGVPIEVLDAPSGRYFAVG